MGSFSCINKLHVIVALWWMEQGRGLTCTWKTVGLSSWTTIRSWCCRMTRELNTTIRCCTLIICTGVNPTGDDGDTSPNILVREDVNGIIPPILLHTFGYCRPILVALCSFSLKPISFGYKTPPIRFSQAGRQSAHEARPPTLNSRWCHWSSAIAICTHIVTVVHVDLCWLVDPR